MSSLELIEDVKEIISEMKKIVKNDTIIDTGLEFTCFFNADTEDWEINAFSLKQLQNIVSIQCEHNGVNVSDKKLLSISEDQLREEVKDIRTALKEKEEFQTDEYNEYKDWIDSFQITYETTDDEIKDLDLKELKIIAKREGFKNAESLNKNEIIMILIQHRNIMKEKRKQYLIIKTQESNNDDYIIQTEAKGKKKLEACTTVIRPSSQNKKQFYTINKKTQTQDFTFLRLRILKQRRIKISPVQNIRALTYDTYEEVIQNADHPNGERSKRQRTASM